MTYQPAPEPQSQPLENYEIELAFYKLHEQMFGLAVQSKIALNQARPILQQLNEKDPDRARRVAECFRLAVSLLKEATYTVGNAVDWGAIEELYYPAEEGFVDTPVTWQVVGRANAQRSAAECAPAPVPRVATVTIEAPPVVAPMVAKGEPKTASRAQLASLGRSLKRDTESEKRRFYAIAKRWGLPTDKKSEGAMFEALSALFGETITSRRQLDANKWGRAASAIEMQEMEWTATARGKNLVPAPRV